ncbi:hypothetical protein ACFC60_26190 [Kitasatospora purpeofusca]|uniref:hypothetical protein n=1 Tax=Kitasatospora purpeofusca TaxID=67352 RepID=UPI0035DB4508
MLEQLDPQPGERIFEAGAGTGVNAAHLGHLVDPDGHVVTVDVDVDEDLVSARLAIAGSDVSMDVMKVACRWSLEWRSALRGSGAGPTPDEDSSRLRRCRSWRGEWRPRGQMPEGGSTENIGYAQSPVWSSVSCWW